jgi:hypothetical protein
MVQLMVDPLPLLVLFAGRTDEDLHSLAQLLGRAGYLVKARRVSALPELREALLTVPWQIVVANPGLPALSLPQIAAALQQTDPELPLIVVAGPMVEAQFGAALRAGAAIHQPRRLGGTDRLPSLGTAAGAAPSVVANAAADQAHHSH